MNEFIYKPFSSIVTLHSLKNIPHLTLREHLSQGLWLSENDSPNTIITWKSGKLFPSKIFGTYLSFPGMFLQILVDRKR